MLCRAVRCAERSRFEFRGEHLLAYELDWRPRGEGVVKQRLRPTTIVDQANRAGCMPTDNTSRARWLLPRCCHDYSSRTSLVREASE